MTVASSPIVDSPQVHKLISKHNHIYTKLKDAYINQNIGCICNHNINFMTNVNDVTCAPVSFVFKT